MYKIKYFANYINGDMMKKIFYFLLIIISLVGCSLNNTPSSKVEELFGKYNMIDKDIEADINSVVDTNTGLTDKQKDRYKEVLKKQYKNLSYEIKDETIDGNKAVVKVEIEVIDYKKAIKEVENKYTTNDYTLEEFNEEKLDKLENYNEKVVYTLELNLTKDKDGNWSLDALPNNDIKKIQGMF